MAEEEITAGILIDEAEGVEFDAFAESEAMHEDEFVDGILEWKERIVGLEAFAVQDDMATRKGRIEPGSFIRTAAEGGTGEIKSSATVIAMGGPEASGSKVRSGQRGAEFGSPGDVEFEVARRIGAGWSEKRNVLWIESDGHTLFAPKAKRKTTNPQSETSGFGGCLRCEFCAALGHGNLPRRASSGTECFAEKSAATSRRGTGGAKSFAMAEDSLFGAETDTHDLGRLIGGPIVIGLIVVLSSFFHQIAFLT
jgi:hypothetical protein